LIGFDEVEQLEQEQKTETQKRKKVSKTATIYEYPDKGGGGGLSSQDFLDQFQKEWMEQQEDLNKVDKEDNKAQNLSLVQLNKN